MFGDNENALKLMNESIQKRVENPQSLFLMSQLYEDRKQFEKALVYLNQAVEKFPKNPSAHYNLGVLQDKMNKKEDMVVSMKNVLALDSAHPQAMNYLAYTWAEKGVDLDLAESYARKALSKDKDDPFVMDTLAWVLFKKGQFKDALSLLEKASKLQPQVSIIAEHLGDVYEKMEREDDAHKYLKDAVEFETDHERKKELINKLANFESRVKLKRVPSSTSENILRLAP
jgi:tetratricopeptide (TPR) repeat protein